MQEEKYSYRFIGGLRRLASALRIVKSRYVVLPVLRSVFSSRYKPDARNNFLVSSILSPVQCSSFKTRTKSALEGEGNPVVSPCKSCCNTWSFAASFGKSNRLPGLAPPPVF